MYMYIPFLKLITNYKHCFFRKIINKKQIEKIVEVTKNTDIARGKLLFGYNKVLVKEKCDIFTLELNGMVPPIRSVKGFV